MCLHLHQTPVPVGQGAQPGNHHSIYLLIDFYYNHFDTFVKIINIIHIELKTTTTTKNSPRT